jgi:hypothetical protein
MIETYNFKYLYDTRNWFFSIFGEIIRKEGWNITHNYGRSRGHFFTIIDLNTAAVQICCVGSLNAFELAKQYGWIVDYNGIVLNFDIDKLERNRHLLTGLELGLI